MTPTWPLVRPTRMRSSRMHEFRVLKTIRRRKKQVYIILDFLLLARPHQRHLVLFHPCHPTSLRGITANPPIYLGARLRRPQRPHTKMKTRITTHTDLPHLDNAVWRTGTRWKVEQRQDLKSRRPCFKHLHLNGPCQHSQVRAHHSILLHPTWQPLGDLGHGSRLKSNVLASIFEGQPMLLGLLVNKAL